MTRTVTIETTPGVVEQLGELVATGHYGFTVEEAAERLLSRALEERGGGWPR